MLKRTLLILVAVVGLGGVTFAQGPWTAQIELFYQYLLSTPQTFTGNIVAPQVQTSTIYSAAGTPLPTCNGAAEGMRASVSDATAPTFLAAYVSGGAVHAPVYCNGTAWLMQ